MKKDRVLLAGGQLPDTVAAHACWEYVCYAHVALYYYDAEPEIDGVKRTPLHLDRLINGVALRYGLEVNEVAKYFNACRAEAFRSGMPYDERVERIQKWIQ